MGKNKILPCSAASSVHFYSALMFVRVYVGFNSLNAIYKLISNGRLVESDDLYFQLKRSAFSSGIDRLFIEIQ